VLDGVHPARFTGLRPARLRRFPHATIKRSVLLRSGLSPQLGEAAKMQLR